MPRPHDLCARIQNAFRARRAQVAVPHTVQNLGILNVLLRAGFINSITRGTLSTPDPIAWQTAPESKRMIWADLKYREDRPVLTNMELDFKALETHFHGHHGDSTAMHGKESTMGH
jgi:ribosomal protein S8